MTAAGSFAWRCDDLVERLLLIEHHRVQLAGRRSARRWRTSARIDLLDLWPSDASPSEFASRRAGSIVRTSVRLPRRAAASASAAAVVVLPTPPEPTQTRIRALQQDIDAGDGTGRSRIARLAGWWQRAARGISGSREARADRHRRRPRSHRRRRRPAGGRRPVPGHDRRRRAASSTRARSARAPGR